MAAGSAGASRNDAGRARVELLPYGRERPPRTGPAASVHEAKLWVAPEAVAGLLTSGFLQRVAASYGRFLRRISGGLLRIRFEPGYESLVLLVPRPHLLRLHTPVGGDGPDWAEVRWGIKGGLLVAPAGRDRGSLRIRLCRLAPVTDGEQGKVPVLARMEVEGYYPRIRGRGRFAGVGAWVYAQTQARIHTMVMRGFLRSLSRLELPPSPARSPLVARGGR